MRIVDSVAQAGFEPDRSRTTARKGALVEYLRNLLHDARLAVRLLIRKPGESALLVRVLAI